MTETSCFRDQVRVVRVDQLPNTRIRIIHLVNSLFYVRSVYGSFGQSGYCCSSIRLYPVQSIRPHSDPARTDVSVKMLDDHVTRQFKDEKKMW